MLDTFNKLNSDDLVVVFDIDWLVVSKLFKLVYILCSFTFTSVVLCDSEDDEYFDSKDLTSFLILAPGSSQIGAINPFPSCDK